MPDYPDGPLNVEERSSRGQSDVIGTPSTIVALKMEEEVNKSRKWAASRSWRTQGNPCSPRDSRKELLSRSHLDCSL